MESGIIFVILCVLCGIIELVMATENAERHKEGIGNAVGC